jgi:hypothetical protein
MEALLLEKEAVENLLPQKFPFVMVDKMYSFKCIRLPKVHWFQV